MAEPLVKVYYSKPILPDVSRVLACLYEKQIKYDLIKIYPDQHSAPVDILKLQSKPSARVHGPAFEDGEIKLFESRAICRHLVEKYGGRGNKMLLGRDLLERASIERWLKTEEHSFDPPSWTLIFNLAFAPAMGLQQDHRAMEESARKLSEVLDVYEQRLGDSTFLAGDEFTLADLSHLPSSHYLKRQDLFTSRENVSRWLTAISERDSWREVVKILNSVPVERVSSLTQQGGGDTDRPSPPAPSQLSQAVQSPVQPVSSGQPVQLPTEASQSTPVSTTTQPEGQTTTMQAPSRKIETPVPPISSPQQGDKSITESVPKQVSTQSNGTTKSAASSALSLSSSKQGNNGEKSVPPSGKDTFQKTTKTVDNESTKSVSNATPEMRGSLEQIAQQSATGTDGTGSTKTGPTQQATSQPTPGKGVSSTEQGSNSEKSGPQSAEDSSRKATKTMGHESTQTGSNATPAMQGSSEQIAQQTTSKPTPGKDVSSPEQGTSGGKSDPQSTKDTSPKATKTMEHESTQSQSNANPPKQDNSKQMARQPPAGTNHAGPTKTGSTQQVTSQPTPGKGMTDEISGPQSPKDSSQKGTKTMENESTKSKSDATPAMQGSSEEVARQQAMGKDHAGSTETGSTQQTASQLTSGKDVPSPEQGTSRGKSDPQSIKNTSPKATKAAEYDSTQSGSNTNLPKQDNSEQTAHQPAMGTNHAGSTETGSTQQATSQATPGKDASSPEQGTSDEQSGPQPIKDTSPKGIKTMENESTKSRSDATPAMQGSSEEIARQQATGKDHGSSTKIGPTQQATPQTTAGKDNISESGSQSPNPSAKGSDQSVGNSASSDVSSEQGTSGENFGPQSNRETS